MSNEIERRVIRAQIGWVKVRQRVRRRLRKRGSRRLNSFNAKDALAAATFELFEKRSLKGQIFESVFHFQPNDAQLEIDERIGKSSREAMENLVVGLSPEIEQVLLLNHLWLRHGDAVSTTADLLRSAASIFIRNVPDVECRSELEEETALVASLALLVCLKKRRYELATEVVVQGVHLISCAILSFETQ
jgi:hypothetical protein